MWSPGAGTISSNPGAQNDAQKRVYWGRGGIYDLCGGTNVEMGGWGVCELQALGLSSHCNPFATQCDRTTHKMR